ncbi:hypothetical protein COCSADRAFT_32358 [Bipolaris sorokiniana ND90Pr]|uniref:Uncharacterized protein n=1 Tax=Cochliobolus sativus (strain ND90Pr / ATCC 201652) TaxID=665912 RepID=M2RSZ1_COCSN|nr:uncharacterized protein COCSADRAFT_32358 [Bipolaris sorokiniana ND90Pr]EMD69674.1 hypothetical protein COCSADRAFT_32358 [Bipolaris sorokiniana ND90Pr]
MSIASEGTEFRPTITQPIVNVEAGDATNGFKTALSVEVPLMVLAISTVLLRVYSRLAIKKKLAADDILILLGTVCSNCAKEAKSHYHMAVANIKPGSGFCTHRYIVHECRG